MTLFTLDLAGRPVLVVGGGPRAARRALDLLAEGARVHLVAPDLGPEPARLAEAEPGITLRRGIVTETDVSSAWLVCAAEADDDLARQLRVWCEQHRVPLEGVSAHAAVARTVDGHRIAVQAQDAGASEQESESLLSAITAVVHDGALARRAAQPHRRGQGRVVLVGGGPGAADLLTLRGRRELARADVVVTDRLAPLDVLNELPTAPEIVHVGKNPYHHPVPQDEINRILVDRAQQGQYVVRLKGGDPFVLGRGGEELVYCRRHGVPVDVVPGVSSALAGPAAAHIPLTHRGIATGFVVRSGHADLDTASLATTGDTIVVLMGMARLGELCAGLVRDGMDPATPAAVVHKAWLPDQRVVRATVATLADKIAAQRVTNPAVVVIGTVVAALDDQQLEESADQAAEDEED